MKINKLSLGPLGTNCYIVSKGGESLIFDPGGDSATLIHWLNENKIKPIAICLTHGHFDHIGAVDSIRELYGIPVYLNEEEATWLTDARLNGSALFPVEEIVTKPADYFLPNGDYELGQFNFEVIHTPGHSPGGVTFIFNQDKFIIGGDSLFYEGIGRTDLPGGDMSQLLNSINKKLFQFSDDYVVYPGHGPETKIGHERKYNPFLK